MAALSVASWLDLAEPLAFVDGDAPVVLLEVSPFESAFVLFLVLLFVLLFAPLLELLAACAAPPFFGSDASCDSSALISALSWSMAVVVLLELDDDEPPPPPPPPFDVEEVDVVPDVLLDVELPDDEESLVALDVLDEAALLLAFDVLEPVVAEPLAVVAMGAMAELVAWICMKACPRR
ncbi:hypothetical protein PSP6_230034 [Paraburkholderia tropica]|uniref:hypothetical protein n=1 Tax=Paraburkholderia tropica TaxID=92647 RepID=UPI001CAD419A|nr:hypothetical protein [Paraburkholderia tropica]CAG9204292.1 hypothetical protein PSP6_230034 [Paraburkholderia tropica]